MDACALLDGFILNESQIVGGGVPFDTIPEYSKYSYNRHVVSSPPFS